MANPFGGTNKKQGVGRIIGRRKTEAADAVETLLVRAGDITSVTPEDVTAACKSVKLDSVRHIRKECKVLYARYLDYCFEDRQLSLEESVALAHLKVILGLSDADVSGIQDDIAIEIYGQAVAEVLEDLRIDPEEAEFLRRLQDELQLAPTKAHRILEEGTRDARGRALRQATASDQTFVERREAAGSFTGRSHHGLEAAVNDALTKAYAAIPKLQWFEVNQISGYVENGAASQWYVVLDAGIDRDDR